MYSMVLMVAMAPSGDVAGFGHKGGCNGCYGGGCSGSSCHGGGGFLGMRHKHGCSGGCYGGCW